MSSKVHKYEAWELSSFLNQFQKTWSSESLYSIKLFDAFFERIVQKEISEFNQERSFAIFNGKELRIDWLTENALNYDLFSESEVQNFAVVNADQCSTEVQNFFYEHHQQLTKRFLFYFRGKSKFLDGLAKNALVKSAEFSAPKFWDYSKYFSFLIGRTSLQVDSSVAKVSFEGKDLEVSEIAQFANQLEQEFVGRKLDYDTVQKVLDQKAEDRFYIAELLMGRKYKSFYDSLLKISNDKDLIRSVAVFLQGHFLKVKYPTYLKPGKRLSRYDRAIQSAHNSWSSAEIEKVLELLSEIEMMTKVGPEEVEGLLKTKKGELTFAQS